MLLSQGLQPRTLIREYSANVISISVANLVICSDALVCIQIIIIIII